MRATKILHATLVGAHLILAAAMGDLPIVPLRAAELALVAHVAISSRERDDGR